MGRLSLRRGSIVEVYLDDLDGKPSDHDHPAIVIVVHDGDEEFEVMAISTKLGLGATEFHVEMPYGPNAKSGLVARCVAKPEWTDRCRVDACRKIGFIPTTKLAEVLENLAKFKAAKDA